MGSAFLPNRRTFLTISRPMDDGFNGFSRHPLKDLGPTCKPHQWGKKTLSWLHMHWSSAWMKSQLLSLWEIYFKWSTVPFWPFQQLVFSPFWIPRVINRHQLSLNFGQILMTSGYCLFLCHAWSRGKKSETLRFLEDMALMGLMMVRNTNTASRLRGDLHHANFPGKPCSCFP